MAALNLTTLSSGSSKVVAKFLQNPRHPTSACGTTTTQLLRHVYKYKITISGQIYEVIPGPMQREDKSQ